MKVFLQNLPIPLLNLRVHKNPLSVAEWHTSQTKQPTSERVQLVTFYKKQTYKPVLLLCHELLCVYYGHNQATAHF